MLNQSVVFAQSPNLIAYNFATPLVTRIFRTFFTSYILILLKKAKGFEIHQEVAYGLLKIVILLYKLVDSFGSRLYTSNFDARVVIQIRIVM